MLARALRTFTNLNPLTEIIRRRKEASLQQSDEAFKDRTNDLQDYLYQRLPYDFKVVGSPNCPATQRLMAVLRYHQLYHE
jgi:hypothetical protein